MLPQPLQPRKGENKGKCRCSRNISYKFEDATEVTRVQNEDGGGSKLRSMYPNKKKRIKRKKQKYIKSLELKTL